MADSALAYYCDGVWEQVSPREGWLAFVKDDAALLYYDGAAWTPITSGGDVTAAGDNAFTGDNTFNGAIFSGAAAVPAFTSYPVPTMVRAGAHTTHNPTVTIRHTTPGAGGAFAMLAATRGVSEADYTIVQNGDGLGSFSFHGADGSAYVVAAVMKAQVDGTPGANDMPGRLIFATTADGASNITDRWGIYCTGHFKPIADNAYDIGASATRAKDVYGVQLRPGSGAPIWTSGAGSPQSAVTAPVGSLYTRTDGGANTTLYVKESGTGNTGWVAK
jgi:hypothetical protein